MNTPYLLIELIGFQLIDLSLEGQLQIFDPADAQENLRLFFGSKYGVFLSAIRQRGRR